MSMSEMKLSFSAEKLEALRYFMDKKQQTIEQELQDYLEKTYEKSVPAQVREYVENRMEQVTAPQEEQMASIAGTRPPRQTRHQREQAAAEHQVSPPSAPAEGAPELETQGMTMNM